MLKNSVAARIGHSVVPLLLLIFLVGGSQTMLMRGAISEFGSSPNIPEEMAVADSNGSVEQDQETRVPPVGRSVFRPDPGTPSASDPFGPSPGPVMGPIARQDSGSPSQPRDEELPWHRPSGSDDPQQPQGSGDDGDAGAPAGIVFHWDTPSDDSSEVPVTSTGDEGAGGVSFLGMGPFVPGMGGGGAAGGGARRPGVIGAPSPHGQGAFLGTRSVAGSYSRPNNGATQTPTSTPLGGPGFYPPTPPPGGDLPGEPDPEFVAFGPRPQPAVYDTLMINAGYAATFYNYSSEVGQYNWAFEGGDPDSAVTAALNQSVNVTYNTPTLPGEAYIARLTSPSANWWEIDITVVEAPYALVEDPSSIAIRRVEDRVTSESGDTVIRPVYQVQPGQVIEFSAEVFGYVGDDGGFGWYFDDGTEGTIDNAFAIHSGYEANGKHIVGSFIAGFYVYNMGWGYDFFYNLEENYNLDPNQPGSGVWFYEMVIEVVDDTVEVPEPATLLTLATAIAGVLGFRRRRSLRG